MNERPSIHRPMHASYRLHRRQFWSQIMLPVLLGVLLCMVAPVGLWLGKLGGAGDVGRWAAISSIFLMIPVLIGLIIVFIAVIAAIYMAGRLAGWLPAYGLRAQKFAGKAALATRRGADMVHRPVLALRAFGSAARSQLQRLRERA